jgi:hypothetical protein
MLGHGPGGPNGPWGNVDDALQEEIEAGVEFARPAGHRFFSFSSIR